MQGQPSGQINLTELKFSRDLGFFDKSRFFTYLIALLFVAGLFFILHFREVKVPLIDLNTMSQSYIVAEHDADFYDEEATIILKQEAVRDIGKIYQLQDKQVRQRKLEFENYLLYNQEWGKEGAPKAFEDIYRDIDNVEKVLLNLRFTDPRTLQKMKDQAMDTNLFAIYTPATLDEETDLPSQIWKFVFENAFPNDFKGSVSDNLAIAFFKEKAWHIEEDIPAERNLRRKIQASVPEKYTHIMAGSRVIDQGERVTARHIAMINAIKQALSEERQLESLPTIFGTLIMATLLAAVCGAYFKINYPEILLSNRKLFLLVAITLLTLGFAKATEYFLLGSSTHLFDIVRYPIFVPFAAILLCSLVNPGVATFAAGFLTILLTVTLVFDSQGFMIMNLAASVVAVLTSRSLKRRKEIFVVCGKAWLACILVSVSIHLYNNSISEHHLIGDAITSGIFLLVTAILVVGILPLLESSFKVMTDSTLMEYMDPNNDLLRRLSIEAPGTYQHSVVVGNIAETAALAIGANGLFCRVATLYHDIGKMATPQYFTENQMGGLNVHQLLTPLESAQVIMAHVPEGVSMAKQAGLPLQFIDIIKEHHGTTLVYYFYRKQLELLGGDKSLIDEKEFRYLGPKPRSKESAIIMIADSFEAASRSLDKMNEETLTELATRLIREKVEDGQFDDCLLTFEELAIVKATLVKTIAAYSHSRVKYPKREPEKTMAVSEG